MNNYSITHFSLSFIDDFKQYNAPNAKPFHDAFTLNEAHWLLISIYRVENWGDYGFLLTAFNEKLIGPRFVGIAYVDKHYLRNKLNIGKIGTRQVASLIEQLDYELINYSILLNKKDGLPC